MSFQLSRLTEYYHRHPGYMRKFIKDLLYVYHCIFRGDKIVVVTTESEGLGGYIWIRNYYKVIKEHYAPKRCCIILAGMYNWTEFIQESDTAYLDVFRPFESCDSSKKVEKLFFKLFIADVFLNFRAIKMKTLVKARRRIFGRGYKVEGRYYEEANNATISQWIDLPQGFKHTLPLRAVSSNKQISKPYIVLVEGGHTQGKLSQEQLIDIVMHLIDMGYHIFYNGNANLLKGNLQSGCGNMLVDGYQYPLSEYATIISDCTLVVTPNTLLYHYAVQLDKPCVVLSANEYQSVKLDKTNQIAIFNPELQTAIDCHKESNYRPNNTITIAQLPIESIIRGIDSMISRILQN